MLCVPNMEYNEVMYQAWIAQWVEHRTINTAVAGSIPAPTQGFQPFLTAITGHEKGLRGANSYSASFKDLTAHIRLSN